MKKLFTSVICVMMVLGIGGCGKSSTINYDYLENQLVASPTEVHNALKNSGNEIKVIRYDNNTFAVSSTNSLIHGYMSDEENYQIKFDLDKSTYVLERNKGIPYAKLKIELPELGTCSIDLTNSESANSYPEKCTQDHIKIANDEIKNFQSYFEGINFNKDTYIKYFDTIFAEGIEKESENNNEQKEQKQETNPIVEKLKENGYVANSITSYSKETTSDDGVDLTLKLDITNQTLILTDGKTEIKYNYYTHQGYAGMCVLDLDTGAYDTTSSILSRSDCKGTAQSMNYLKSFFEKELQETGITIEDLDSLSR